jgi:hypothetical protein
MRQPRISRSIGVFLAFCSNCRLQGTSIELYTWCKDRALAIYSSCVVAVPR